MDCVYPWLLVSGGEGYGVHPLVFLVALQLLAAAGSELFRGSKITAGGAGKAMAAAGEERQRGQARLGRERNRGGRR